MSSSRGRVVFKRRRWPRGAEVVAGLRTNLAACVLVAAGRLRDGLMGGAAAFACVFLSRLCACSCSIPRLQDELMGGAVTLACLFHN